MVFAGESGQEAEKGHVLVKGGQGPGGVARGTAPPGSEGRGHEVKARRGF